MPENKPFIVRNDKPHNVEVVAGSLNAKGRKSWVKAQDEDHESKHLDPQSLELEQNLQNILSTEAKTSDSSPVITHALEDNQSKLPKEGLNSQTQKLEHDESSEPNVQSIASTGPGSEHIESLDTGAYKDRSLPIEHSSSSQPNDVKINQEKLSENLQKVSNSSLEDNLQKVGLAHNAENLAKIGNEQLGENVQTIDSNHALANKVKIDQAKDSANLQTLTNDPASKNNAKLDLAQGSENVQTLGHDHPTDNKAKLQALNSSDNIQGIDPSGVDSNKAHLPSTSIDANRQDAGEKSAGLNQQVLPKEESSKNSAQIDGTVYDLKHQEKVYSEKLQENVVALAPQESKKNQASIESEKLSDEFAKIPSQSRSEDVVGLPSEAPFADNKAKIDGTSIADRRAKFDEIRRQRSAAQQKPSSLDSSPEGENLLPASGAIAAKPSKPLTREEQIAMARKKKSDEFHGRVEAIKNTVTQLNNQLDKLEDTSIELKKIRY